MESYECSWIWKKQPPKIAKHVLLLGFLATENDMRYQHVHGLYGHKQLIKTPCDTIQSITRLLCKIQSWNSPWFFKFFHMKSLVVIFWIYCVYIYNIRFFKCLHQCIIHTFLSIYLSIYPILSYPILSYPILSYPILSYPILSYPILSYPILSYPIYLSIYLQLQVDIFRQPWCKSERSWVALKLRWRLGGETEISTKNEATETGEKRGTQIFGMSVCVFSCLY